MDDALADIVKSFGPEFLAQFADRLSATQHRALRDIAACRSAALGGHVAQCHDCGYRQVAYNSCRNRHCPKCQAAARAQWTEARTAELLPVPYFHVVFTMPAELRPVALQNKRVVYDLLFRAAAESLQQLSADPKHLGAQIGCLAVLHTWSQNLMHHPHVHCIVPAGGLTPDNQWVTCRRSPKTGKVFFLPIKALSRLFRGKLVAYLKQAHRDGRIQFRGDLEALSETTAFHGLLDVAVRRDWVVYVKRPFGGPEQVLKYLARYTHRVAISNQRLLELQDGQVRFRWKDYADHGIRKVMTLSASEFLRRFLLHVLPSGFMRIRYYGFLGNRIRREKLALCRELIGERMLLDEPPDAHHVEEEPEQEGKPCPQCRSGRLLITETIVPHEAHRSIRPWHLTRVSSASPIDTS